jgi:hypothetical protein
MVIERSSAAGTPDGGVEALARLLDNANGSAPITITFSTLTPLTG